MTQNPWNMFSIDFMKGLMPSTSMMPFDFGSIMETGRKNMQAMTEIQQRTAEGMQAIAKRQAEIMSRMVQDHTTLAQQMMTEGTPEEKVARQADIVLAAYENSMTGMTELSEMMTQTTRENGEIINKRVTGSLTEFKKSFDKDTRKAA